MNRNQRVKNRRNAEWLRHQQVCPECGERGRHYISGFPMTLAEIVFNVDEFQRGFWTCAKFYGPDGRRLEAA